MVRTTDLTQLATITGEQSINRTARRFGCTATDLGIPWDTGRGEVLVAFGDTYGAGWGGNGAGPETADWRCNVLGRSTNRNLDAGLILDSMIARPDGTAAQVLDRDPDQPGEVTVIPTTGITVGGRDYLHYMSVRSWGAPGTWITNHAGIAVSDDGGTTWTKPPAARWINRAEHDHPFQLGAFAAADGQVYLLGTPNGRFGDGHLARVAPDDLLRPDRYAYWTGTGFGRDPFAAVPVLPGPVGELSLQYNSFLGQWLAMHLDEHRAAIVLRSAPALTGPWSGGEVVVSGADRPGLYGGYLHPWSANGPAVYFTMSEWGPYNVSFLRARLVA